MINTELYKIKHSKLFWGFLLYFGIFPIIIFNMENLKVSFSSQNALSIINGEVFFMMNTYIIMIYSSILLFDFKSGFINESIALGISRLKIWFNKTIIFCITSTLICLTFSLNFYISKLVFNDGFPCYDILSINVLLTFILMTVTYFTIGIFISTIIFAFPNPFFLVITIVFINLFCQGPIIFGFDASFLKYIIFTDLFNLTDENIVLSDIIRILFVCLYTIILSILIVKNTFIKRDLK